MQELQDVSHEIERMEGDFCFPEKQVVLCSNELKRSQFAEGSTQMLHLIESFDSPYDTDMYGTVCGVQEPALCTKEVSNYVD